MCFICYVTHNVCDCMMCVTGTFLVTITSVSKLSVCADVQNFCTNFD